MWWTIVALLATTLTEHVKHQYAYEISDANRMQNIMTGGLGLLIDGGRGRYTLAELPLLFYRTYIATGKGRSVERINPFARKLLDQATHPGVRSFWQDQWGSSWNTQSRYDWVQSSLGRIYQYNFDQRAQMTFCAVDNATLNFPRIVEEGCWLFVNLAFTHMPPETATLIGNMIISRLAYAALNRSDQTARPYRLFIDEARFFNTGPLELIMETSRFRNLWLTLIVQSIGQLASKVDGRPDRRLEEMAVHLTRYYSIFQDVADREMLAKMIIPLTGTKVMGIRPNGQPEYLPAAVEQDHNERRFTDLRHREVLLWDKEKGRKLRHMMTPFVAVPEVPESRLVMYETEHLRRTGKPAHLLKNEIAQRQAAVRAMLVGSARPTRAPRKQAPRRRATPPEDWR